MNKMIVERPGMYSLIQDMGRYGFQQYGVSVNGPMDEWSHRVANLLVGNDDQAAVLECTLTGPHFRFTENTLIAITGATMRITLNGKAVPMHRAVMVKKGQTIRCEERLAGARTYIAVQGGFATPLVMDSRSTNVKSHFGGVEGRILQKQDQIAIADVETDPSQAPLSRRLVQSGLDFICARAVTDVAIDVENKALHFIAGPQWVAFTPAAQQAFTHTAYAVSTQSDRMGYRLKGETLTLNTSLEMISEATCFGTVQVPPDGQPIVLMADRQSAGGYPKIAYVTATDLPYLAQALPGEQITFVSMTQEDAERHLLAMEHRLTHIKQAALSALAE